jgi:hypothetical protein
VKLSKIKVGSGLVQCGISWRTITYRCEAPLLFNNVPLVNVPVCDFCFNQPVIKRFKAHPFVMHPAHPEVPGLEHPLFAHGDWCACIACARLVDAGRWDALIERAFQAHAKVYPELRTLEGERVMRESLRATYETLRLSMPRTA